MKYRPEVDGLRAVAVLSVIFCHAGFQAFAGGFVGVDIFFVISGYLITTIIHGEIEDGRFSIVRFYERRVRRILPALFLVSAVTLPFAWAWMLPQEFKDFAQSLVAVNLFASNMLFAKETGYFAGAAELKPMLHTWSLAVEEQFYVVFPLVLLAARKLRRGALIALLTGLCVVSLAFADWLTRVDPTLSFYLLPTRAWELGVGAILAISANGWSRVQGRIAEAGGLVGMGMILVAIFAFDDAVPFPGVWGLLPVLGTAIVIACARPTTLVGRVLSSGPMVGVGLISYSAYLWHQPLFAFARIRSYHDGVSDAGYLGLAALALGLAYLSWRFVERPFRDKTLFTRAQIFPGAAVATAAFIGFGLVVHVGDGLPGRLPPQSLEYVAWTGDSSPYRETCNSSETLHINPTDACVLGDPEGEPLVVWGDSHGVELAWRLSEDVAPRSGGVKQLTHNACIPSFGVRRSRDPERCLAFTTEVAEYLGAQETPPTVVVIGRWPASLDPTDFDNGEGGAEHTPPGLVALPLDRDDVGVESDARVALVSAQYRDTIESLLARGSRVVLVYNVPEMGWNVPQFLARERQHGIERDTPLSVSHDVFRKRSAAAYAALDAIPDDPNLIRVRPEDIFCDTFEPGRCVAQLADGEPLYFDDDHLNSVGAEMLAEAIIAEMDRKGWL